MASLRVWTGSTWKTIKAVKIWNGSKWVERPGYRWTGSKWESFTQQELWLYELGTEHVSWMNRITQSSFGGVTFERRSDHLYAEGGVNTSIPGASVRGEWYVENIDLTNVQSLYIDWSGSAYSSTVPARLVVKRSDGSEAAVLSKTADFSRRINQLNVASLSGVHTIAIEVSAFRPPTAPYPIGATSSVRLYRLWGE